MIGAASPILHKAVSTDHTEYVGVTGNPLHPTSTAKSHACQPCSLHSMMRSWNLRVFLSWHCQVHQGHPFCLFGPHDNASPQGVLVIRWENELSAEVGQRLPFSSLLEGVGSRISAITQSTWFRAVWQPASMWEKVPFFPNNLQSGYSLKPYLAKFTGDESVSSTHLKRKHARNGPNLQSSNQVTLLLGSSHLVYVPWVASSTAFSPLMHTCPSSFRPVKKLPMMSLNSNSRVLRIQTWPACVLWL